MAYPTHREFPGKTQERRGIASTSDDMAIRRGAEAGMALRLALQEVCGEKAEIAARAAAIALRAREIAQEAREGWDRWYATIPEDILRKLSVHDFNRLGECFKKAFEIP